MSIPARILSALLLTLMTLPGGVATAGPPPVAEIRIADGKGDWGYPNPYRHYPRGPGYLRMSWVFDTLVWKDRNGFVPALAESWSFDAGRLTFVFTLNPKARWHDGRPVTAADVVFTLDYFKAHPYRWISVDSVGRAEALGPHRVAVHLSRAYAPFLSEIGGTMPILPRHIWEAVANPESFHAPDAYVGSGPYVFRDFDKTKGSYLYEAFPDYYQGRPRADRLIYVRSKSPLIALTNGQADLANIQPDMAATLERSGLTIIEDERGWNKKLMINHRKPPFDDRRFRRAIAHAVDRNEVIAKSQRGYGTPASYGLLSVDHEMYNPETPAYAWDPAEAERLIVSLGYRRGADGVFVRDGRPLEVELLSSNITVAGESVADRDGEILKRQLEAVGIRVDLVNMEQATTDTRVRNWDFDLAVSGHGGICGDPRILNEMISPRYAAGSVNSARYDANPELERLLEEQLLAMDPEKRRALVYNIQEIHARDLPAIPLYYPVSMAAYRPDKGIAWFYTRGGIGKGIPIPQNKMALVR